MNMFKNTLFLIPARGGSKGIPEKNIKFLGERPLIHYSIEYARLFTSDINICLSTDDNRIISCAHEIGLNVNFIRPKKYSTDTANTFSVIKHALTYYQKEGINYTKVVLLQPTSPFRKKQHLIEAMNCFDESLDLVVSVVKSDYNPYYNLFEEVENKYLEISKGIGKYTRRQDCPPVFAFNGSIYIFNALSIENSDMFRDLKKTRKYVMEHIWSNDIDSLMDWEFSEFMLSKLKLEY